MSSSPAPITSIPTVNVTLTFTTPVVLVHDLNTYWMTLSNGVAAALSQAMTDSATTFQVSQLTPPLTVINPFGASLNGRTNITTPVAAKITVGVTVLIDSEPMSVTAVSGNDTDGYTVTVSRGTLQTNAAGTAIQYPLAVKTAHTSGTDVAVLTYPSGGDWMASLLLPQIQTAVGSLGSKSAAYAFTTQLSFA